MGHQWDFQKRQIFTSAEWILGFVRVLFCVLDSHDSQSLRQSPCVLICECLIFLESKQDCLGMTIYNFLLFICFLKIIIAHVRSQPRHASDVRFSLLSNLIFNLRFLYLFPFLYLYNRYIYITVFRCARVLLLFWTENLCSRKMFLKVAAGCLFCHTCSSI